MGIALGLALAAVIAGVAIGIHDRAELSVWTQGRTTSARRVSIVVGLVCALASVAALAAWVVAAGGPTVRRRRWRVVGAGLGVIALAICFLGTQTVAYVSSWTWVLVAAGLMAAVMAVLARSSAWRLNSGLAAMVAVPLGLAVGAGALAVPIVRHPIPPDELIDWWAAHDNPPILFVSPMGNLRKTLEVAPRVTDDVAAACREWGDVVRSLAGPPAAPLDVRSDVETLARDLNVTAERCEAEASTITTADMQDIVSVATTSDAARRLDDALHLRA